jgi:hypothetical protein
MISTHAFSNTRAVARRFVCHRNRLLNNVPKRVKLIIRADRSDPAMAAAISEH